MTQNPRSDVKGLREIFLRTRNCEIIRKKWTDGGGKEIILYFSRAVMSYEPLNVRYLDILKINLPPADWLLVALPPSPPLTLQTF